jgi:hypothetical protein
MDNARKTGRVFFVIEGETDVLVKRPAEEASYEEWHEVATPHGLFYVAQSDGMELPVDEFGPVPAIMGNMPDLYSDLPIFDEEVTGELGQYVGIILGHPTPWNAMNCLRAMFVMGYEHGRIDHSK